MVDDDLQYRRALRIALTVRGYDVREAANGFEALDEMRLAVMDVILMDWIMPGMDGEATCRAIRATSSVPIIVVTASDRVQEALAAGADAGLKKPVNINSLLARTEAVLGGRGTSRR
ncbi:MAG: response regulator [Bryobacteraceae bacterium]